MQEDQVQIHPRIHKLVGGQSGQREAVSNFLEKRGAQEGQHGDSNCNPSTVVRT